VENVLMATVAAPTLAAARLAISHSGGSEAGWPPRRPCAHRRRGTRGQRIGANRAAREAEPLAAEDERLGVGACRRQLVDQRAKRPVSGRIAQRR